VANSIAIHKNGDVIYIAQVAAFVRTVSEESSELVPTKEHAGALFLFLVGPPQ
jgi:hypothetical protein